MLITKFPLPLFQAEGASGSEPNGSGNSETNASGKETQIPSGIPAFSIDPAFANLPVEIGIAKTVQKIVTPLQQKIAEQEKALTKMDGWLDSIALIRENEEARNAFIKELAPDLISPIDVDEKVKKELDKKYGNDFIYDSEAARSDRFSPSAKYDRDYNRLMDKYEKESSGSAFSKSYKEVLQEVERKAAARKNAELAELEELRNEFKLMPSEERAFLQVAKKFKLRDLYMHYKAISATDGLKGNLTHVNTGNALSPNAKLEKAIEIFGNPVMR